MKNGWLLLLCAPFIGVMIFLLFTRRGRAWLMGGKSVWAGEEHVLSTSEFFRMREVLQMHQLTDENDPSVTHVGLEVRVTSAMSVRATTASLTLTQARALRDDLSVALSSIKP